MTERAERGLAVETIPVAQAAGHVLAADLAAPIGAPAIARAERDGVAVRAADTAGAGLYNPIRLGPEQAPPIELGDSLPAGFDAVLPWETVLIDAGSVTLAAPAAAGEHISRPGADWCPETTLARRGDLLSPPRVGLLIAAGVETVPVRPRPRVRLVRAGHWPGVDANTPMLAPLVTRDGGIAETEACDDADTLRQVFTASSESVVIAHGASGWGGRDFAASALANAGTLAWHGVAAEPGASFGAGVVGDTTVLLLPGSPWACLAAYELFAGPLLRALAGLPAALPHATVRLPLGGKLVSPLGLTELCPVAMRDGSAYPLPQTRHLPPPAAAGFVPVEEGSEGFGEGSIVEVRLW